MTEAPNVVTKTPDMSVNGAGRAQVLAEVLETVHLSGAVFLQGEFAEPWGFDSPSAPDLTASLAPGARQLVLFHAVLEGECHVQVDTGEVARLGPGELVVLPYGNQHRMFNPDGSQVVPIAELLPPPPWANMQVCRFGDPSSGRQTRILCSYLECEDILFSPLLGVLPPLIKVTPSPGAQAEWLRASLQYTRALGPVPTSGPLAARLPEMLLLEALRQYLESVPPDRSGWLAALADAVVGPALVAMHGAPAHPRECAGRTTRDLALGPRRPVRREAGSVADALSGALAAAPGLPPASYWQRQCRRSRPPRWL